MNDDIHRFEWTDERLAELQRLAALNLSSGQIASALTNQFGVHVGRNAVIGKRSRLGGYSRRAPVSPKPPRSPPTVAAPTTTRRRIVKNEIMDMGEPAGREEMADWRDQSIPIGQRVKSVVGLTDATCRWPVGQPGHPDFFFCGAAAVDKRPYCECHLARAISPGTPSERRATQLTGYLREA